MALRDLELKAYLDRIRFRGDVQPDLETLQALHRAHQLAIPFENIDVQLGRPLTLDVTASYEKIVRRRRGGWCYEMNGIMGWALQRIGFEVTRLSAGVMREQAGDERLGNHLCLLVHLDQPYFVDVGFGGSLSEPLPLAVCEREDRPYRIWLRECGENYWRFSEATRDAPFSFDFRAIAADESLLAAKCRLLQIDAESPFVQNLVVQRRTPETHVALRGRVLTITHSSRIDKTLIESPHELLSTLREQFDLEVPEAGDLWPKICARHEALFDAKSG